MCRRYTLHINFTAPDENSALVLADNFARVLVQSKIVESDTWDVSDAADWASIVLR